MTPEAFTRWLAEMKQMVVDTRAEADIVLSATLDRLMAVLPETEFVAFCEELEAA